MGVCGSTLAGLLELKIAEGSLAKAGDLKWNFCNQEYYEICWFKELQSLQVGNSTSVDMQLPDGQWRLVRALPVHLVCAYVYTLVLKRRKLNSDHACTE